MGRSIRLDVLLGCESGQSTPPALLQLYRPSDRHLPIGVQVKLLRFLTYEEIGNRDSNRTRDLADRFNGRVCRICSGGRKTERERETQIKASKLAWK
jgi:hypothetical protein